MVEINGVSWKVSVLPSLGHIRSVLSFPPRYYQKRIQKIGFTGKNTRLLDAACGAGIWAIGASYYNRNVEAIDATEKYLAVAKDINAQLKRKNLKIKRGKLENLPYPDNYFDYIICYDAWMYTQRAKSLREMARVLKSGGKIYLGCIAGLGWYLSLIVQGLIRGDRGLILLALGAMKNRVFMAKKTSLYFLAKEHFQVLGFGSDGQIGDPKIKIKPVYPPKFLGFWRVYEILAEKIK